MSKLSEKFDMMSDAELAYNRPYMAKEAFDLEAKLQAALKAVQAHINTRVELTERLAQAEREVTRLNRYLSDVCDPATLRLTAERDAALAEAKEQTKQRDFYRDHYHAALAKAEGFKRDQKEATETALRNMAKAEAAEAEMLMRGATLTDLRARIEALAEKWEGYSALDRHAAQDQLRALLQTPKAETALDVLERIQSLMQPHPIARDAETLRADMAKLRKLLEEGK